MRNWPAYSAFTGVTVQKAEPRGKLLWEPDGCWNAFACLTRWRRFTRASLQLPRAAFTPWLDPQVPLVPSVWDEFVRRAEEGGADVRWSPRR
jgi:hypothetical protein